MTGVRGTIAAMITFGKCNKKSLEGRPGAFGQVGSKKVLYMSVMFVSRATVYRLVYQISVSGVKFCPNLAWATQHIQWVSPIPPSGEI